MPVHFLHSCAVRAVAAFVVVCIPAAWARDGSIEPRATMGALAAFNFQHLETEGRDTVRVTLRHACEVSDLKALAIRVKDALPASNRVIVRFDLAAPVGIVRDQSAGQPDYYFEMFPPALAGLGGTFLGVSPLEMEAQAARLPLVDGETITGFWVDHMYVNGGVALTQSEGETFLRFTLDGLAGRYRIGPKRAGLFVAVEEITSDKRARADGVETERLAYKLLPDQTLLVFVGSAKLSSKPWLIARPWTTSTHPVSNRCE